MWFLMFCELFRSAEHQLQGDDSILSEVCVHAFIEHDAYALFSRIIPWIFPLYLGQSEMPQQPMDASALLSLTGDSATFCLYKSGASKVNVPLESLSELSNRLTNTLLPFLSEPLSLHLKQLDISPLYTIKWFRLLYAREFDFEDILPIWTALFGGLHPVWIGCSLLKCLEAECNCCIELIVIGSFSVGP